MCLKDVPLHWDMLHICAVMSNTLMRHGVVRLVWWNMIKHQVKNSYPLPLVSDILTRLCNVEWFTILDLHWGFNNIQLKEGDKWKVAFSTNWGLFKLLIMFFRLCNSPATFQTMMNDILCPFIDHMKLFATWMTTSSTPPPLQTIGESPKRYFRPSAPTNYSSDQRNVSSNIERWITSGLSSQKTT